MKRRTKGQMIIDRLRYAIAARDARTRREWAKEFKTNYTWVCSLINDNGLQRAIKPQRADASSGIVRPAEDPRPQCRENAFIRIPAAAVRAAGFTTDRELHYHAQPGKIVITRDEVPT
jgi:hypothetical protein